MSTPELKMSGGPIDADGTAELSILRKRILAEPDVAALLALDRLESGDFLYLIATPYLYPSHAIGVTDAANENPVILFTCGAEWTAREEWKQALETQGNLQARP
jgi:hypothetical protein